MTRSRVAPRSVTNGAVHGWRGSSWGAVVVPRFLPILLSAQCRLPLAFLPAWPCLAPSVSRLAHHRLITSFEVLQNLTRCIAPKPRPSFPLAFPSPALFRADDDGPVPFPPPDTPFLVPPSAATVDPSRRSHGPNALGACCREGSSASRVSLPGHAVVSGPWSLAPSSPLAAPHPPNRRCLWLAACLTP